MPICVAELGFIAALAELKEAIREADLVQLGPHELVQHRSSIVLLEGTLYTSGKASAIPPTSGGRSQNSQGSRQPTGMEREEFWRDPLDSSLFLFEEHQERHLGLTGRVS